MLLALISPLDVLADDYLFSAHMLQHMLLVLAVPPLLILGLPRELRESIVRIPALGTIERALRNPLIAWTLGMAALWIWHMPRLYDATLASEATHLRASDVPRHRDDLLVADLAPLETRSSLARSCSSSEPR